MESRTWRLQTCEIINLDPNPKSRETTPHRTPKPQTQTVSRTRPLEGEGSKLQGRDTRHTLAVPPLPTVGAV